MRVRALQKILVERIGNPAKADGTGADSDHHHRLGPSDTKGPDRLPSQFSHARMFNAGA
jgi:hypothetical protein